MIRSIQKRILDRLFKISLMLVVILGIITTGRTQTQFDHYQTVDEPIRFFTTDPFRNIYAINDKEELLKFDEQGNLLFQYGTRELGPIQIVDASTPFKVIVFYEETNQLVVLDNNLSEISRMDLFVCSLQRILPPAVSTSINYHTWLTMNCQTCLKTMFIGLAVPVVPDWKVKRFHWFASMS